ncbi:MAG: MCE family protein [Candidatus Lambdaproteobacteria bacterium]|nr:MCE family protein [Candidatus Lambdaproteobacteria bacterium]
MRNLSTELKVGLLILAGVGVIVYGSIVVTGWRPGQGDTYTVYVEFDNVAGLLVGSPVQVSGIRIGQVDSIALTDGRARLGLAIIRRHVLRADARATIKSLGILGDKYVDVILGSSTQIALKDGDSIVFVSKGSDLDSLIESTSGILQDIRQVTASLRDTLGGQKGQDRLNAILDKVASATHDLNEITRKTNERIDSILANLDRFTGSLDTITAENRQNIKETLDNLAGFSKDLKEITRNNRESFDAIIANLDTFTRALGKDGPAITADLRKLLEDNRQSLTDAVANIDRSFAKLDQTMANLQKVTGKLERGEGTLGRLFNDETTVDELNSALEGLNKYLTDLDRIKLDIGVHTEYLGQQDAYKSYLSVYLQPLRDRYYLLQLVDNPRGTSTTKTTATTTGGVTSTKKEVETTEALQLSLIVAQRYYDTVFKGGLMENKFGLGVEQYFGSADQYRFGLDVWDFGGALGPHAKAYGQWRFFSNAFVTAGVDDFLSNRAEFRDVFFGIGIRFNEDKLKPLVSSLPISGVAGGK